MDVRRTNSKILYIMESPTLIKVGISSDPYKRILYLNMQLPEDQHFKVIKSIHFSTPAQAYILEQNVHKYFLEHNVPTDIQGAKTECYRKEILNEIISFLEDNNIRTHYYDPFIYVSMKEAEIVLGESIKNLQINFKVSKAFQQKFRAVIRNLAANICVARGAKIFYTKKQMDSFSIRTTYTYPIFNLLYPAFSSKPSINCAIEVKVIKLNHWLKWFHKYSVANKTHLSNLYSLQIYKYGEGERSDKYLRRLRDFIAI